MPKVMSAQLVENGGDMKKRTQTDTSDGRFCVIGRFLASWMIERSPESMLERLTPRPASAQTTR